MSANTSIERSTTYENALNQFKLDKRSEQHLAEAEFGLKYVSEAIKAIPKGANILEVGSGSGLLISRLAQDFPEKYFVGLEPMGDGFTYKPVMHKFANNLPNAIIRPVGFETLREGEKYDLIFLINVFEHLPDWRAFLETVRKNLKPDGNCIILCPNYSFPYEPHFRLPVFFNKSVTQTIFKKNISTYEKRENAEGLWTSLNFVKLRQVKSKAKALNLQVKTEKCILEDMVSRLDNDSEFSKRQGILGLPISLMRKAGLLKFVLTSSIFENWLPYMHLTINHHDISTDI